MDTSWLLWLSLVAGSLGMAVLVPALALLLLPSRVRYQLWANSRFPMGRLCVRRWAREAVWVLEFGANLAALTLVAAGLLSAGIWGIHTRIVPLPLAWQAFEVFDPDPLRWEHRMEHGPQGDLGAHYEAWYVARGGSLGGAQQLQKVLWKTWPFFVAGSLLVLVVFGRLLQKAYRRGVARLERGMLRRLAEYRWEADLVRSEWGAGAVEANVADERPGRWPGPRP